MTSLVVGSDYIGSCKSNYHTITATTVPFIFMILVEVLKITVY